MFLALWNYICGYVIIYVTGFSVERMLNMAINKGVFIWDIQYDKNRVRIKTAIGNIGTIKDCCIKTGCKMSVEGKFWTADGVEQMSQAEGFCRRNSSVCRCYVHNVDVYMDS